MESVSTTTDKTQEASGGVTGRPGRAYRRIGVRIAAGILALGIGTGSTAALLGTFGPAATTHAVAFEHVWDCCHIAS